MSVATAGLVMLAGLVWSTRLTSRAELIVRQAAARLPSRRPSAPDASDIVAVAELVALGLGAGLPFPAALAHAAGELDGTSHGELYQLVRRIRAGGLTAVLEHHDGALRPLALAAGRAQLTGAPLLPAVEAFVDERLAVMRADRLAATRRLPIRLAVPLAFLVLPGFVLLIAAPAFAATLQRLVM